MFLKWDGDMYRILILLIIAFLCSCSSVSVGHDQSKVILESQKPICDLEKLDEKCMLNTDYARQSYYL